ncbi:MAG: hypothetical protein AAF623_17750 [Planctomycetota bacterium]
MPERNLVLLPKLFIAFSIFALMQAGCSRIPTSDFPYQNLVDFTDQFDLEAEKGKLAQATAEVEEYESTEEYESADSFLNRPLLPEPMDQARIVAVAQEAIASGKKPIKLVAQTDSEKSTNQGTGLSNRLFSNPHQPQDMTESKGDSGPTKMPEDEVAIPEFKLDHVEPMRISSTNLENPSSKTQPDLKAKTSDLQLKPIEQPREIPASLLVPIKSDSKREDKQQFADNNKLRLTPLEETNQKPADRLKPLASISTDLADSSDVETVPIEDLKKSDSESLVDQKRPESNRFQPVAQTDSTLPSTEPVTPASNQAIQPKAFESLANTSGAKAVGCGDQTCENRSNEDDANIWQAPTDDSFQPDFSPLDNQVNEAGGLNLEGEFQPNVPAGFVSRLPAEPAMAKTEFVPTSPASHPNFGPMINTPAIPPKVAPATSIPSFDSNSSQVAVIGKKKDLAFAMDHQGFELAPSMRSEKSKLERAPTVQVIEKTIPISVQIERSIEDIENQIQKETDPLVRNGHEVNLRLIEVLQKQLINFRETENSWSGDEKEFWNHQLDALSLMLESNSGARSDLSRHQVAMETLDHLRQAVERLQSIANLKLTNGAFCREVIGFGQFRPFEDNLFASDQKLLLYCEVENFQSQVKQSKGMANQFETLLKGSFAIYDQQGRVVQQLEYPIVQDLVRNQRRDFYMYFSIQLNHLKRGKYRLELLVEDVAAGKSASLSTMTFDVD